MPPLRTRSGLRRPFAALLTFALGASWALASAGAAQAAEQLDGVSDEGQSVAQSDVMQVASAVPTAPGTFVSLDPARVLDTRVGNGAPQAAVATYGAVDLQVTGRGGVPASGVSAVVVNVTVTAAGAGGFITVFPSGGVQPTASNLNFTPGLTIPNLVTVKVSGDGRVTLANNSARGVHLIADVAGYYLAGAPTVAGAFVSLDPARLLDTRFGIGAHQAPVAANGTLSLQTTGRGGVPSSGVSAVVVNVTVTGPRAGGFLTVYPSGDTPPNASNLNFTAGQSIPNLVTVQVGGDGKINLRNSSGGSVDLIADVAGYYLAGSPNVPGAFVSLAPARILDTRTGNGAAPVAVPGNGWIEVQVADRGFVPPKDAAAVVMNVTATAPQTYGFVTLHPNGVGQPTASNLNYSGGQNIPNLVAVKVGVNGKVNLVNNSPGSVHLIADVAGYFLGSPDELDPVFPTGWYFEDCGTEWDSLILLASPGIQYSPQGELIFFEGEYFYEFFPGASQQVTVTASAAPGYVMLPGDGGTWITNGDGSVTTTLWFTNEPCSW